MNPQLLMMIFRMLSNQAPNLVSQMFGNNPEPTGFEDLPAYTSTNNIEEALERGFDIPSIDDDVRVLGLAEANKTLGHSLHGKNTTEGFFTSDHNPIGDARMAAAIIQNSPISDDEFDELDPSLYPSIYDDEPQFENWYNDAKNNVSDIIPSDYEVDPKKQMFARLKKHGK